MQRSALSGSLERRLIFQTLARSDSWPKVTDCQVRMTPLMFRWYCDYCLQIVTAELDTRAQEMAADDIQAEDTGVKGFNGPKGSKCFRATLDGFKCSRARA